MVISSFYLINDGPVIIRRYAFTCCDVESVILPDSISRIESHAFYGCRKLKDITFGNNLNYIGDCAFEDCINLKHVVLPQSVMMIDSNAFLRAGLEEITLNQGLKKILTGAFYGTNIKKLEIPGSVKRFAPGNINLQLKEIVMFEFSEEVTANLVCVNTKSVNRDTILRLQCGERYVYLPRSIKGSMRNEFNNKVNPPRLIRFREYRRGFQTPHELSFMPATLGRSGFLTADTAQTQWLCRAASPSAGASGFAFDAQSTA